MDRGRKNGVKNLSIIGKEELFKLEPHLDKACTAALRSPDAGTITPYEYAIALCENAVDNGVELRIRRVVSSIEQDGTNKMFTITAKHWEPHASLLSPSSSPKQSIVVVLGCILLVPLAALCVNDLLNHQVSQNTPHFVAFIVASLSIILLASMNRNGGAAADQKGVSQFSPSPGTVLSGPYVEEKIVCKYIVNAAGCASDKIANLVGDFSFKIKPRLGEYILLNKSEGHYSNHVLFPAPDPHLGKGVLVQNTLWGNLILGPTARDTLVKNEATGEYEVDVAVQNESRESIASYIFTKCRELVPGFNAHEIIHTFSGSRAKSTRGDWIIEECKTCPRLIHAAGIDSPGIAGSPAIALEIVRLLREAGAPVSDKNPSFNPYRAPIIKPKDGWKGLKAGPIGKYTDPESNVVCKCEKVTEAEIIEACRRSLPIDSTQAMRKRTRAGMGHCQGDPGNYDCESRVAAIIARETKTPLHLVGKRPWPASSLLSKRWIDDSEKDHFNKLSYETQS